MLKLGLVLIQLMSEPQQGINVGHKSVVLNMGQCVQDSDVVLDSLGLDELQDVLG